MRKSLLLLISIVFVCSGCGKEEVQYHSQPAVVTYHEYLFETTAPKVTVIASEEDTAAVTEETVPEYSCYGSISINEKSIKTVEGKMSVKAEFKSVPVRFDEEVLTSENMDHFLEHLAQEDKEISINPIDEHTTVYTFRERNTLTLTDGELTELVLKEPGETMIEVYGIQLGSYVSDLNKMHKFEFTENSREINEISFEDDEIILTLTIDTEALVISEISLTKIDKIL